MPENRRPQGGFFYSLYVGLEGMVMICCPRATHYFGADWL